LQSAPEHSGTIAVLDDESLVRDALVRQTALLGYDVLGFASAREFLDQLGRLNVDCLIVDLVMPEMDGLSLLEELGRRQSTIPVVMLSGQGDIPSTVRAMRGGALDFLEKPVEQDDLRAALERAIAFGAKERQRESELQELSSLVGQLTERQREVFLEVVTGAQNKVIAYRLGITIRTVKAHRQQVMEKLGVRSVAELTSIAAQLGLIPDQRPLPTEHRREPDRHA
jgi:FixJ family two-component response regulator